LKLERYQIVLQKRGKTKAQKEEVRNYTGRIHDTKAKRNSFLAVRGGGWGEKKTFFFKWSCFYRRKTNANQKGGGKKTKQMLKNLRKGVASYRREKSVDLNFASNNKGKRG